MVETQTAVCNFDEPAKACELKGLYLGFEIKNGFKFKHSQGCQLDYIIQTSFDTLYICEIKFSKNKICMKVVDETTPKIKRLNDAKRFSCRPVLIHVNGVT